MERSDGFLFIYLLADDTICVVDDLDHGIVCIFSSVSEEGVREIYTTIYYFGVYV